MRFAIIENNKVINIIEASQEFADSVGAIPCETGSVGDTWDGDDLFTPPVIPVEVPKSVTMRQARLALLSIGKLDDVSTAIESLPNPQKEAAQIEFEFSSVVERNRPLVQILGPLLGLTEEDLDNLFIEAAKL